MTDSDFWRELAEKFRTLDRTVCLRLQWIVFTDDGRREYEVIGTGDACRTIKVQFEALATRAGIRLVVGDDPSSRLDRWLEQIRLQTESDRSIEGLRAATAHHRFQITCDAFRPYVPAIADTLGDRVSFAQLVKVYGTKEEGREARYSPSQIVDTEVVPVFGNPDPSRICTSIVERQNLTIRMQMRRLTRLTNGFSKKWENLWAAYCLHFAYYNFCRIHRSLRVTPAMETGITDHVWDLAELLR